MKHLNINILLIFLIVIVSSSSYYQIPNKSHKTRHINDDELNISEEDLKLDDEFIIEEESNKITQDPKQHHKKIPNIKPIIDEDDEFDIPVDLDESKIPDHLKINPAFKNMNNKHHPSPPPRNEAQHHQPPPNHSFQSRPPGNNDIPDDFDFPHQAQTDQQHKNEDETNNPTNTKKFELSYEIEMMIEFISVVLFLIFLLNFMLGKVQTFNILEKWNKDTKEFFVNNYAHVGFSEESQYELAFM